MAYNDKQLAIIEAAEALFAENGFNGTSVRDIAEKAGVNLAMISYYFGSKEKLLEALFNHKGELSKMKLEQILSQSLTSWEKVNLLIDLYIDKVMQQQPFHRVMAREQVLQHNPEVNAAILNMKKQNQELIARLIQEGQQNGAFRKQIDIPMLMTTMVGTANQLVTTKHHYRELSHLNQLSDPEFEQEIRKKLSQHLKNLFKHLLTNEA